MREPRQITVTIDGQDVRLLVRPLTVAAVTALMAYGVSRGPVVAEQPLPYPWLPIIAASLSLPPGEALVDEQPLRSSDDLIGLYAARLDVLWTLRQAVTRTTYLSEQERRDLKVATRFKWWLSSAVGKWKDTKDSCQKCIEAKLCAERGCDGVEQQHASGKKKGVWHDDRMTAYVCPVLSLTPDVQAVFLWVEACYGPQDGRYRRIALPDAGGVADQDAWLLAAMAHLASVRNDLIHEGEQRTAAPTRGDEDDDGE